MAITFIDYSTHGSDTQVQTSSNATDPSTILVNSLSNTELDFSVPTSSGVFMLIMKGQFDLSNLVGTPHTLADLNAQNITGLISELDATLNGVNAIKQMYSPAITPTQSNQLSDATSLSALTSILSGNDIYIASAAADFTHGLVHV